MTQKHQSNAPAEQDMVTAGTQTASERQQAQRERDVCEALVPYVSLSTLRRLIAQGDDLQAAFTDSQPLPEAVQRLMQLLRVLLTPRPQECIRDAADLAALLMVEMGLLAHEELWVVYLDTKNHVQRIHRLYQGSLNSSVLRIMWNTPAIL